VADPITARAVREARELHAFFVAWFRADTAGSVDFARCEAALAPDFRMIAPDGSASGRAAVIARLRALRATAPGDFAIAILEPRAVWAADDAVLLEFVEQQYRGGRETRRRSTGLFTSAPDAPNGVVWRHLQETWIDRPAVEMA
jgi:hypothetical protein